jgi:hypothetical protein
MKRSRQTTRPGKVLGLALATAAWLTMAWLTLLWTTACSRQLAAPAASGNTKSSQLPFERVSDSGGISPTAGFTFDEIPAGTEFTIRLQAALSSADSRVGQSFDAVFDEPVIVAGKTVVPRGATVTGSVVAARAFQSLQQPGYLRVALQSIVVNGKAVPLRTSTVFAKGASYRKREAPTMTRSPADGRASIAESALNSASGTHPSLSPGSGDVRFSTGHRLTFRLAHPLHLES